MPHSVNPGHITMPHSAYPGHIIKPYSAYPGQTNLSLECSRTAWKLNWSAVEKVFRHNLQMMGGGEKALVPGSANSPATASSLDAGLLDAAWLEGVWLDLEWTEGVCLIDAVGVTWWFAGRTAWLEQEEAARWNEWPWDAVRPPEVEGILVVLFTFEGELKSVN